MQTNRKQLLLSITTVFAFIFIFDMFWHGTLMKGMYQATSHLWRSQAEMQANMVIMMLGQLIIATALSVVFCYGVDNRGLVEGARFGLLASLFKIGPNLVIYAVAPYSVAITAMWSLASMIEFAIAGVILSYIHQQFAPTVSAHSNMA